MASQGAVCLAVVISSHMFVFAAGEILEACNSETCLTDAPKVSPGSQLLQIKNRLKERNLVDGTTQEVGQGLTHAPAKSLMGSPDTVFYESKQPEPSEVTVNIHPTSTAKSLLSKFRICGHESLIRAGPTSDFGYVIPSWPSSSIMGTMFSIGIRGSDPVSHVISDKFGVAAHLYDCFSGPSPCPTDLANCNVTFHHICAGGKDIVTSDQTRYQTIQSMVQEHAPESSNDMILKIDCEGCEWDTLDALPEATLSRFKLLITEMHSLEIEANHEQYLRVMTKLTSKFAIVHTHGCNAAGQVSITDKATRFNIPMIVEATFVRKDLLTSPQDCSMEAEYLTDLDFPTCGPGNGCQIELRESAFKLPPA